MMMNVLSLFDGMSCGQIALERAGIPVENYFASEIDKWAIKITQKNYPKTIQFLDEEKLYNFLERGGGFALGLTQNTPESLVGEDNIEKLQRNELQIKDFLPSVNSLIREFEEILNDFTNKGLDTKLVVKNLILTPQCGFQSFTIPSPERGEQIVKELLLIQEKTARKIQKKYS